LQRDADQVSQHQIAHAPPEADPLAKSGAAMVPAALPIAGVEEMRSGAPLHERGDKAGMGAT